MKAANEIEKKTQTLVYFSEDTSSHFGIFVVIKKHFLIQVKPLVRARTDRSNGEVH